MCHTRSVSGSESRVVGVCGKGLEGMWPGKGLEGVWGKGLEGGDISEVLRMVMPESELDESCRSLSCNTARDLNADW